MKLYATIAVFALLVFGVGWTSHDLLDGKHRGGDRGSRSSDRGRRHSGSGPYLATVERFAEELALTGEQRAALDELMHVTAREIEAREREQQAIMLDSRRRLHEILTQEQEEKLAALEDEKWRVYREERVTACKEFAAEAFGPAVAEPVAAAVGRYERAKAEYFRSLRDCGEWPGPEQCNSMVSELRKRCEHELAPYLGPEQLEVLWKRLERCSMNGPPRSSRDPL